MRLWFVYTRTDKSTSADHFCGDGLFLMFHKMLAKGIIDECFVVVEGGDQDRDYQQFGPNYTWMPVKKIDDLRPRIKPGDIVWIRGGFKPTDFYQWCQNKGIWMLFYGANTGRERWPFWDIIFDDLGGRTFIDTQGRLILDYRKPVNEEIFFYQEYTDNFYDICIGASFIHDKKGQWAAVDAMVEYKLMYGVNLRAIMPGVIRHGIKTNHIMHIIKRHGLDVKMPGMITRTELAKVFNQSKMFLHFGSGQNDRSLLEAMACGCLPLVGQPRFHAKWIWDELARFNCGLTDFPIAAAIACDIEKHLKPNSCYLSNNSSTMMLFQRNNGLGFRVLPMMAELFGFLRANPRADRKKLEDIKCLLGNG